MIHLTLTGYYAGVPLCNVNKREAISNGDVFYHAEYFHDFENKDLCPKCKEIWFDYEEVESEKLDKQVETGRCSDCGKPVIDCVCDTDICDLGEGAFFWEER